MSAASNPTPEPPRTAAGLLLPFDCCGVFGHHAGDCDNRAATSEPTP